MAHLLTAARTIDEYLASGGGDGLRRAVELGPAATVEEVLRSGLRGRGGAGFPTGRKWAGVRSQPGTDYYAVANGAEGEPGTFKDRTLMRTNPYQLVEGLVIAAFAVGAVEAFIAIKASFTQEYARVVAAVEDMQRAGLCADCQITIVQGPEDYLYGEEKAMLEVIEGNAPLPRILPPFEHGLFATVPQEGWDARDVEAGHTGPHESNPTLVNNVETLSTVPHILARGADWFRGLGTADSPGTTICTVVGDTRRAGVAEVELGTPIGELIELIGGGPNPGRTVKAVLSGVANRPLTGGQLSTPLSYEGFAAAGSGMGSAGLIVYDDTACMVEVARVFSAFLATESCGQCSPCKLGTAAITEHLAHIQAGSADRRDFDEIGRRLEQVTDASRCYLPSQERAVVAGVLSAFRDEVDEHLSLGRCPRPRPIALPKLVDIVDGRAAYAGG